MDNDIGNIENYREFLARFADEIILDEPQKHHACLACIHWGFNVLQLVQAFGFTKAAEANDCSELMAVTARVHQLFREGDRGKIRDFIVGLTKEISQSGLDALFEITCTAEEKAELQAIADNIKKPLS